MIRRVVAFFDERESPSAIALIRILVGVVILVDLTWVGIYGLPTWLWAPIVEGGTSPSIGAHYPQAYAWFGVTRQTGLALYVVMMVSGLMFTVGFFTRTAAFVFVLAFAQTAMANDYADRGIDRAIRIVILILAFSAAGTAWSVDARRKTGAWRGTGAEVLAWPRYLVLGQLVLMYCAAGFSKGGTLWFPWGGYAALYVILQDPIYAVVDFSWAAHPIPYFFTQVGTAGTHFWEMGAPIVLVAAYFRRTADKSGRLRTLFNRFPVRNLYVAVGVVFHLTLVVSLRLGIFPFAMLAFFPAFFRPEEIERFAARVRTLVTARFQGSTSG